MTETTPAPATEAVQQAQTTALPTDSPIDHGMFVPQATRENYLAIIRDQAAVRGDDVDTVRVEMVEQFEQLHGRQPLDGYDHLAGWLEGADLSALSGPTGMQQLIGRTLESARRDPQQAVIGDQALVEVAVSTQLAADEAAAAAAVAPSVDPTLGMLPNAGPLPVPADVTTVDPDVAEQQQAAQEQTDQQGNLTDEAAAASSDTSSAPEPSPTPSPASIPAKQAKSTPATDSGS